MSQELLCVGSPVLKAIVVGNSGVGKTCLIGAFVRRPFDPISSPTVTPAYACQDVIRRDGLSLCLQVWDTAGQDRHHSISALFYREADVALVCYEAGSHHSMQSVGGWVKRVRGQVPNCSFIFVATKADLLPKTELAAVLADARGALAAFQPKAYVITSAMTGEGIEQLFREVAEQYIPRIQRIVAVEGEGKKSGCCNGCS
jgi:small GTP-binding protein